ncbi:hypothetical protein GCM10010252_03690 [Streptomyces aureoverticillatus]|nr:hypothetical protein GCM10010252_03690 [Streptomyces aureoverticillatus]
MKVGLHRFRSRELSDQMSRAGLRTAAMSTARVPEVEYFPSLCLALKCNGWEHRQGRPHPPLVFPAYSETQRKHMDVWPAVLGDPPGPVHEAESQQMGLVEAASTRGKSDSPAGAS